MPEAAATALENTTETPVAEVIPSAAKSGLTEVKADYGAGEFWKDEPAPKAEPAKMAPKVEEKKSEAGPLAKSTPSLLEKVVAKGKPAVSAEDAAPTAKVEAVKQPEDDLQLDPKASKPARENFENLKNITKGVRSQLATTARELAEARQKLEVSSRAPTAEQLAEVERLKAESKVMSDKLLLIDTKNHPAFQAQYVKPRHEALANATELLKAHGKDADLASLIEKPRVEIGKTLQELLKDIPAFDQTEISNGVQAAWKLAQAEKQALANAGQVHGALRQQETQTQTNAFDSTWAKVSAGVGEFLQPEEIPADAPAQVRKGLEEWNGAVKSLQDQARKLATGAATHESIAEASIKAAAYDLHLKHVIPRLSAEFQAMQDVVKQLKDEVEGYRSRNPNKTISATPAGGEKKPGEFTSIDEAGEAMLGRMGKG